MKRRLLPLFLSLCLLCSLFPAAGAEEDTPSPVTALCVTEPGQSVFLDSKEFQLLCRQATGHDLESVTFSSLSAGVGKLAYLGERITTGSAYYMYRKPAISQVCFTPYSHSSGSFSGQAELAFTMTSEEEETVSGVLIFYVPEETDLSSQDPSLMDKTISVEAGKPVDLCDHLPSTVWYSDGRTNYGGGQVTSATFALPSSDQGSLWMDYEFEDDCRKLLPDEVLFPDHAPNYHCLTFVPAGKEETQVRLNFTVSSEEKKNLNASLTLKFVENKTSTQPSAPDTGDGPITACFQDMTGWEWAVPAAEFLEKKGYRRGDSWFYPGQQAARVDLIYALALAAYSNSIWWDAPVPAFSDLPADETLANAVAVAADRGLVLGNGAGLLLPDDPITRQDALVIIHRAMVDRRKLLPPNGDLSAFSDAGEVAPYAQEAAAILAARGVLQGDSSGKLDPLSPITRAEMACLLYRAFA